MSSSGGDPRAFLTEEVKQAVGTTRFEMFAYSKEELVYVVEFMFESLGFVEAFGLEREVIVNFLHALRESYNDVPFHNFYHCFCVAQMVYCVFVAAVGMDEGSFLDVFEKFTVFVSALCHDVDHPGFSNSFQVNAGTPLAMLYNDISCLENHHCSQAFGLFAKAGCNMLAPLSPDAYRAFRALMVKLIITTDMANHFTTKAVFDGAMADGTFNMADPESRTLLCQIIILSCDISNEVRPHHLSIEWANRINTEFGNQVVIERARGLPVLPHMDPDVVVLETGQIAFIDNVLLPIWLSLTSYVTALKPFCDAIVANRDAYAAEWEAKNQ